MCGTPVPPLQSGLSSNQFKPERAANNSCGTLQRGECYVSILWIKKATDLAAACAHAFGESLAREIL